MDFLNPQCAARSLGAGNSLINTFLTTMISVYCNISTTDMWPEDYGPTALQHGLHDYDFVVIGAGASGSVVAARLAENPNNKILLLEAGGDPPIESEIPSLAFTGWFTKIDWQYQIKSNGKSCLAHQNERGVMNMGKVLGGSHSTNGMFYYRGTHYDFDEWESQGNPSWGWDNVTNYFEKLENYSAQGSSEFFGTRGPLNLERLAGPITERFIINEAAYELGYRHQEAFSPGNYIGYSQPLRTVKGARRMSTFKAYIDKTKPNLHVIKNAIATRITFNRHMHARSVEFVYKGQHEMEVKPKKEIIVSCGAIETPKLLMLSGIGPKKHLDALGIPVLQDLPVGNNLHDHARIELFMKLSFDPPAGLDTSNLDMVYNYLAHGEGVLTSPGVGVGAFVDTDNDGSIPDVQFIFSQSGPGNLSATMKQFVWESISEQTKPGDRIFLVYAILVRPKSRGYVRLRSQDYQDPPIVYPNFLDDYDDVKSLISGINQLIALENTKAFKHFNGKFLRIPLPECDAYEYRSFRYWKCYLKYLSNTTYHPAGTAKMGPKRDSGSVVNAKLRLRGVKGVRVVDASIMPDIVRANPVGACAMIGEKGTDFIKHTYS